MSAYLDHAATTPMVPAAIEAYAGALARVGNPSSLHSSGRAARALVEESREQIAELLGARPSEVIFTSGGTEADNLAIKGTMAARAGADPARRRLVVSAIEHHAVLDPVEYLITTGAADVTWLEPDACGLVSVDGLTGVLEAAASDVALVSVMWANNEVGSVQPIGSLAEVARARSVPMHSDAVQAVGNSQGEAVNKLLTDVLGGFTAQMDNMFGAQMRGMNEMLVQTANTIQSASLRFEQLAGQMQQAGAGAADAMATRIGEALQQMQVRQSEANDQMRLFIDQLKNNVASSQSESAE
ncbi:MAG TPA: aminotransferase class V-fold PLP-dependent enzyme, partial [Phycicoccus sp.]|nr:aminotransferase class V-fold PLP-dependent enzyme [Phycicoccus sp.]